MCELLSDYNEVVNAWFQTGFPEHYAFAWLAPLGVHQQNYFDPLNVDLSSVLSLDYWTPAASNPVGRHHTGS